MTSSIDRAIAAYNTGQYTSLRACARVFEVTHSTLARRLNGQLPRNIAHQQRQILTTREEEVVIEKLLYQADSGYPYTIAQCLDICNGLLQSRQNPPNQTINNRWFRRFCKRHSIIQTAFSRPYDYQRAKAEDPEAIQKWLRFVESKIQEYGAMPEDIYNFDETGFTAGRIVSKKVIGRAIQQKGSSRLPPRDIQSGDRTFTTVIECISGAGVALPPLILLPGKSITDDVVSQQVQHGWRFMESHNGWTNDKIALLWLREVFEPSTKNTSGVYRLLILDGHGSHLTNAFNAYCSDHKIVPLCMPAHSSHLLQPLDISVFGPLKRVYGPEIQKITAKSQIVTRSDFIAAYAVA